MAVTDDGVILHLMGWDRKFVPPFIAFVRANFPGERHEFVVYGDVNDSELQALGNVTYYSSLLKNIGVLSRRLRQAKQIILHGMFSSHLIYVLFLQSRILKKTCWVLWGGDLYAYRQRKQNWRARKNEFFRAFVIKRMGLITTTVPGDYDLAKSWYKTRARYIQNLMYGSHLYREDSGSSVTSRRDLIVQIGNSADPSNNHKEIIDKLAGRDLENVVVTAPLSYGDKAYAKYMVDYGRERLGGRFEPLLEFMSFEEYNEYLKRVDIVILNHDRQQGMGNMIGLLSLGKKVYLRSDITPWKYFVDQGLHVFDCRRNLELKQLDALQAVENQKISRAIFNKTNLVDAWRRVFLNEQ